MLDLYNYKPVKVLKKNGVLAGVKFGKCVQPGHGL
jgi:hypothetical protein